MYLICFSMIEHTGWNGAESCLALIPPAPVTLDPPSEGTLDIESEGHHGGSVDYEGNRIWCYPNQKIKKST